MKVYIGSSGRSCHSLTLVMILSVILLIVPVDSSILQKTHQTGHPSRNHPATENGEYPATYDGADSATFYKVRDFILS